MGPTSEAHARPALAIVWLAGPRDLLHLLAEPPQRRIAANVGCQAIAIETSAKEIGGGTSTRPRSASQRRPRDRATVATRSESSTRSGTRAKIRHLDTYLLAQQSTSIIELAYLEELAEDATWEFAFIGGALKLRGADAAPFAPDRAAPATAVLRTAGAGRFGRKRFVWRGNVPSGAPGGRRTGRFAAT